MQMISKERRNQMHFRPLLLIALFVSFASSAYAQAKRKVIIDQDARGPATTDQQSILVFLQSPEVETLGITVVSGDMWRDEEVAHTLRMLEIVGRTDISVVPGAVFPLINREELILRWEQLYGKVSYKGAWNKKPLGDGIRGVYHGPNEAFERRRRAFHHSHGPQISTSGDDLRGRPAHEYRSGHQHRSGGFRSKS